MKRSNHRLFLLFVLVPTALTACGGNTEKSSSAEVVPPTTFNGTDYYDAINERVGFENGDLDFDETLSDGVLADDNWWVLDGYWDAGGETNWHNGVRSRNVRYIKDGNNTYLGIRSRGMYSRDSDLAKTSAGRVKPEGAVIMSKNFLKPGRFEIDMRTMPREGCVTAMWTYYSATNNEETSQNEIDIELGGSGQYKNEWTTTWTTHTTKETDSVDCSPITYFNDGKFHKYTFDWYTDYLGSGKTWIDWFVDGVLIKSITGDAVPFTAMPLWIGTWLPSWAGNPYFDTDYLIIKEISYKQFDSLTQYATDARGNPGYAPKKPSVVAPETISYSDVDKIEKLSNGSMESLDMCAADSSYYGWNVEEASKGSVSLNSDKTEGSHSFALTAGGDDGSSYFGEYLNQKVTCLYEGFKLHLKVDAKLLDAFSSGNIEIRYLKSSGVEVSNEIVAVEGTSWRTIEKTITMPKGAEVLQVGITSETGTVYYDNASLRYA